MYSFFCLLLIYSSKEKLEASMEQNPINYRPAVLAIFNEG
jgi:hypothetical protein